MNISCIKADKMEEYFIAKHKDNLDKKLQSKLGKYAEITINTIANEYGGDISLSLGAYDLREELINFSNDVAAQINNNKYYEYIDITSQEIEKSIYQYIQNNNLNVDIDWEEDSKSIQLFFNDKNYKDIEKEKIFYDYIFIVLDELYNAIYNFLNKTIYDSIREFNEAWVYEYSLH